MENIVLHLYLFLRLVLMLNLSEFSYISFKRQHSSGKCPFRRKWVQLLWSAFIMALSTRLYYGTRNEGVDTWSNE